MTPALETFTTDQAPAGALEHIRALLTTAFDPEFSAADWEHALGGWHVVVHVDGSIVSHAAVVPRSLEFDGRRPPTGYVEAVATSPAVQGRGHGSLAMREVERILRREFAIGVLSTDRHGFYERLGWEPWKGPTYVRTGARLARTRDEDDGIMVLRVGPQAERLTRKERIVAEARPGDDW